MQGYFVFTFHIFHTGEEVSENYYPIYTLMPREIRQDWLFSHYCFQCNCSACVKNYPLLSELKKSNSSFTLPWRCLQCHEYFENGLCLKCRKTINMEAMNEKLDVIKKSIEENKNKCLNLDDKWMENYVNFCENTTKLTTILGPNCEIVIENDLFFRALLQKLFGNK